MNPLALVLFGVAALFGFSAVVVGGGLNVLWLLGLLTVIGGLVIQVFAPWVADETDYIPSKLDALDGIGKDKQ